MSRGWRLFSGSSTRRRSEDWGGREGEGRPTSLERKSLDVNEARYLTGEGLDDRPKDFWLFGLDIFDNVGEVVSCVGEVFGGR